MTRRQLIDICLAYPDAYEDYPFDGGPQQTHVWTVMRHRQNRKSFALIFEKDGLCVNLKCEPMRADLLRQLLPGVTPAWHMNKTHWNTVRPDQIAEEALREMIDESYLLTRPKQAEPAI